MNEIKYYGYPESALTIGQIRKAIQFAETVEPWLILNVGDFGSRWFVELDYVADSLRVIFADDTDEAYFKLAWLQGAKLDYEMGV